MNSSNLIAVLSLVSGLAATAQAADEHGHDHGAAAAPAGPAQPRFSAASDAFELVGVINGKQLTVYLDRFADNAPVQGASIELEIAGAKLALTAHDDGEYRAALAKELQPGTTAITALIVTGAQSDLLAADLHLPEATQAAESHTLPGHRQPVWAAAALAAFALAWGLRRWRLSPRRSSGGAV